jgi:hypothetical protein
MMPSQPDGKRSWMDRVWIRIRTEDLFIYHPVNFLFPNDLFSGSFLPKVTVAQEGYPRPYIHLSKFRCLPEQNKAKFVTLGLITNMRSLME